MLESRYDEWYGYFQHANNYWTKGTDRPVSRARFFFLRQLGARRRRMPRTRSGSEGAYNILVTIVVLL